MNKRCALFLALLLVPAVASAETLRIDKDACRYVTRHQPDAGVAYQPGRDVHGKPVAPADLNAADVGKIEEDMRIRLTTDAVKIFGLKVPEIEKDGKTIPLADPQIENYVTMKDGVPYLNGHPLESGQQRELLALCRGQKSQDKRR